MSVETHVVYQVWIAHEGVFLEIGLDGDGLLLEIRHGNEDSRKWFGETRLPLGSAEFCKALGEALIKASETFPED